MLGLASLAGCGQGTGARDCRDFTFDKSEWRRAYENYSIDEPTEAQRIADTLVRCRVLKRKGFEVRRLLGDSDDYVAYENELSWNLGSERGYFSIDDEHLVVRFSRRGKATRVYITTD